MLSFKSALLFAASTSLSFAEPVTLEITVIDDSKTVTFSATSLLVDKSGVCLLGLPNDVTIQKITTKEGKNVKFISYDAYARYGFVKVPQTVAEGKKVSTLSIEASGEKVKLMGAETEFLVVGDVGSHNGKVIPFSFKRLHAKNFDKKNNHFPFIVNAEGGVLGMLHSNVLDTPGAFYSVPSNVLQKHLQDVLDFSQPTRAWVGVTLDANLGLPVVRSVRPASAAAGAGIQKGDIITKIDSKPVANYKEAVKAFYLIRAEKEAEFEVVREDKRIMLTFAPKKYPGVSF